MDLRAGTVVVLRNQEIVRYRCEGPQWKFWWFEFTVTGASLFPVGSVIDVPRRKGELQDFRAAFLSLRRRSLAQRTLATACFSVLLSHWMARTGDAPHARHEDAINGVIDTLMDRLECGWPIGEMAAAAGMSERAFRTAFHEVTGLSPKTFYDHTRLTLAEEMLKLGAHNVSEIAGRLGYSSPFHFSKAFKQKYGIPPARMLNRENGRASSEQA